MARRQVSGRPRSVHVDEKIRQVNDIVLTQDQPQTYSMSIVGKFSHETAISKAHDRRMIKLADLSAIKSSDFISCVSYENR